MGFGTTFLCGGLDFTFSGDWAARADMLLVSDQSA
jgi:hypothetical protein